MGYRNYIGSLSNEQYNEIKNLTKKELYELKGEDEKDGYVGSYDIITTTHHELGKYVEEFPNQFYSPVFLNDDLQKYMTQENDFYKVEKEFLAHVIESYSLKVRTYYEKMLEPLFPERTPSDFLNTVKSRWGDDEQEHTFDFSKITDKEQTALWDMIHHIKSMAQEWGVLSFNIDARPYNLNLDNVVVSTSWKYEYAQFELVRIYKTFDWDNNVMVYYGY